MPYTEIKNAYEAWCKARDWSFGPTISPRKNCDEVLEMAQKKGEDLGLNKIDESLSSEGIVNVASPWHAAVYLFLLQHYLIKSNLSHMVFRGQKRSSWNLITSIDRLNDNEEAHFRAFVESIIFSTMMKNLHTDYISISTNPRWNFELILPLMAYFPVAQHHGIPTPFLDFTADPSVAVFFASRDTADADETASVYCYRFPFSSDKSDLINMRFAPPFIRRPYIQKGIFTETPYQGDLRVKIVPDLEIRFPVRRFNAQFEVVREEPIDILPEEDDEIRILKDYAKAGVSEFIFESQGKIASIKLIQDFANRYAASNERLLKSIYKSHVADPMRLTAQYVDEFEDMLYWFCYHPHEDGLSINRETLKIIARSNPEIVKMVIAFYRWLIEMPDTEIHQPDERRKFIALIIEELIEAMKKSGFNPDKPVEFSKWLK